MYLALDLETGGLLREHSILSIGFVFADDNFQVVDTWHSYLEPNDGNYIVSRGGMKVNKINLCEPYQELMTYKQAGTHIYSLLHHHSKAGKQFIDVVVKGLGFDLHRIWDHLITRKTWDNFCSRHAIEVGSVFRFLQNQGKIDKNVGASLSTIAEHFGMETSNCHDALADAELTLEVLKRLNHI